MALPLDIIVAGPSESRMVAAALAPRLQCRMHINKDTQCTNHPTWKTERNATFLEECRQAMPLQAGNCANQTRLVWAWQSYANIDPRLEQFVNATRGKRRHVLFYNVGAHYFVQFPEFKASMFYQDTVGRPQEWLNQYYIDMTRLIPWLQHWRDTYGCVLWKTIPIFQPRQGDVNQSLHPSSAHGVHAMMNKWTIAMAAAADIPVLDIQSHTIWESTVKSLDDFYHGWDFGWQADELLNAIEARGC